MNPSCWKRMRAQDAARRQLPALTVCLLSMAAVAVQAAAPAPLFNRNRSATVIVRPSPWTGAEADPAPAPPQLLPAPGAAAPSAKPSTAAPGPAPGAVSAKEPLDPGIRPIGELTLNVAPPDERNGRGEPLPMPETFAERYFRQQPQKSPPSLVYGPWLEDLGYGPSLNFCYRPLYFEEVNLERYGHRLPVVQPALSAAKFYGSVVALPYRLVAQPPFRCTYHDHPFRPGAPAPRW